MDKNTETPLATRPKNPLGPVLLCPCGRLNDSGRDRECPDCDRAVKVPGTGGRLSTRPNDFQPMYDLDREAMRQYLWEQNGGLSQTAAYGLGLFVAHDVREATGR